MTALFVGSLGCFISLLSVYKRLWRAKTEEASIWFSHDHKYPSCWERGGFRLVSEEQGQAKLDCPSVKKPPVAAEGTFPVPTGTLCRRHTIAAPPTFCILFFFFFSSTATLGCFRGSWFTPDFTEPAVGYSLSPSWTLFAIGRATDVENTTSAFWLFYLILVAFTLHQLGYLTFRHRKWFV